jgi:NAD(P)H-dependent FMN reductase
MITVISGTNRPNSKTRKIAVLVQEMLTEEGEEVALIDLANLPAEIFADSSYASKPESFEAFQNAVFESDGLLTVVPEYNGSFPGVLKYFIDMLRFPESLYETPAAFVGISSGRWGGLRAVEHLEMVFQYRHAHLFGRRCFIPRFWTSWAFAGICAKTIPSPHISPAFCCGRCCSAPRGVFSLRGTQRTVEYALRALQGPAGVPTGHGTSPPSRRQPGTGSGSRPRPGSVWEEPAIGRPLVGPGREGGRLDGSNPVRNAG